jgi:thymidylate synthase
MINLNSHASFATAFVEGLRDLLVHGVPVESILDPMSPGTRFGRVRQPTIELIGYGFTIEDPLSCLFLSEARPLRLPYLFGQLLWSLAGSDDADWLSYYHSDARVFADDEHHLSGAFGKRLLDNSGRNQITAIAERLIADPTSRRTVATIAVPEDNFRETREYPCAIAVQYFLREEALHAVTYMRSQSALGVLPYDVFLFVGFQALMASQLQVAIGRYQHICGTFHLYASEVEQARRIVDVGIESVRISSLTPVGQELEELRHFEKELRQAAIKGDQLSVETFARRNRDMTTFAAQTEVVLLVRAFLELDQPCRAIEIAKLLPEDLCAIGMDYIYRQAAASRILEV